ncbi:MAG: hypothetical protein GY701_01685, partial [Sulfitobacter sp.]|nr:hypothetical protein [Sulfitobacter sp.]
IRTLAVIFTLFSTAALAQPVIKDGKEWLQPADFLNLSWNDVALICDPDTGLCDGQLNNIDVTGYTWASVDEVNGLFNAYGIIPPVGPGPDTASEPGSSWAPQVTADFATETSTAKATANGWTRTPWFADPNNAHLAAVVNWDDHATADIAVTGASDNKASVGRSRGVWLHRVAAVAEATPVPTVPTYGLIFTVLGLLAIATRRLSRRNAREG